MSVAMSPTGQKLLGAMRRNLELLVELEKTDPAGVVAIVSALVSHLRSWKPMAAALVPTPPLDSAPFALVEPAVPPETHVRRELEDGAGYDLRVDEDGHLRLVFLDVTGDNAMHHFERKSAEAFRDDFARVLAAMGAVR